MNAERRRFYARSGDQRSQQFRLRSHDVNFVVRNLDGSRQGTQMIAAVTAIIGRIRSRTFRWNAWACRGRARTMACPASTGPAAGDSSGFMPAASARPEATETAAPALASARQGQSSCLSQVASASFQRKASRPCNRSLAPCQNSTVSGATA